MENLSGNGNLVQDKKPKITVETLKKALKRDVACAASLLNMLSKDDATRDALAEELFNKYTQDVDDAAKLAK